MFHVHRQFHRDGHRTGVEKWSLHATVIVIVNLLLGHLELLSACYAWAYLHPSPIFLVWARSIVDVYGARSLSVSVSSINTHSQSVGL